MTFSGQGAQWAKMGADLCLEDPKFGRDIEDMSLVLQRLRHPPDWELKSNDLSINTWRTINAQILQMNFSNQIKTVG